MQHCRITTMAFFICSRAIRVNAVRNFEQDIRLGETGTFPLSSFYFNITLQQRDTANALRVRNSAPRKSR
jgi:hypothetical protein